HACATHGLSGDVDAALINGKLAAQSVHNFHCQPVAVAKAGELFCRPLRRIVSDPSPVGLRYDNITGKMPLALRKEPNACAENIPEAQLFQIVVSEAAAMQIHN